MKNIILYFFICTFCLSDVFSATTNDTEENNELEFFGFPTAINIVSERITEPITHEIIEEDRFDPLHIESTQNFTRHIPRQLSFDGALGSIEPSESFISLNPKQLTIQHICDELILDGTLGNFTIYNLDAMAGLLQGLSSAYIQTLKDWEPLSIFKKPVLLSGLENDVKKKLFQLPMFPHDIKQSTQNLAIQIFFFPSSILNPSKQSVYCYASRSADPMESENTFLDKEFLKKTLKILKNNAQQKLDYLQEVTFIVPEPIFDKKIFKNKFSLYSFFAHFEVPEAYFHCGKCYYTGDGVSKRKLKAFKYFERAAQYNVREAFFHCGYMLYYGKGIPKDKDLGVYFLTEFGTQSHVVRLILYDYENHSKRRSFFSWLFNRN